jgi:alkylated DNA repair protein (DNA oxidative demethylase)
VSAANRQRASATSTRPVTSTGTATSRAVGDASGLRLLPGALDADAQRELLDEIAAVLEHAPPYRPTMPKSGQPMSVRMTNAGSLGWLTDRAGYRYQPTHPETGHAWPAIPPTALAFWRAHSNYRADPEACLVNLYDADARMGLHRDADEAAKDAPVLSISLGDTALFRVGGAQRSGPTRSFRLASGDIVILAGDARHFFHGIDRIMPGTSRLPDKFPESLRAMGIRRINLTLRRVTVPG